MWEAIYDEIILMFFPNEDDISEQVADRFLR